MTCQNSSKFKIQKLPLPEEHRGRPSKYPIASLKRGECFMVPANGRCRQTLMRNRLMGALNAFKNYNHSRATFSVRISNDGKSIGVWRIS